MENLPPDFCRVEGGRQIGLFVAHLLLMIELQLQAVAKKPQRRLWVRVITKERLPVFNDLALLGVGKPDGPFLHRGL